MDRTPRRFGRATAIDPASLGRHDPHVIRALAILSLSFVAASSARAEDRAPIIVVFESAQRVDADGLRRAFAAEGVRAVGVADEGAVDAREWLTIAFARDGRTATAWLRGPRGSAQRRLVAPRRDRTGRWVVALAAALVHETHATPPVVAEAPAVTEVLDPWAPSDTSHAAPARLHRVPTTEVLDPWAASPQRVRRVGAVRAIASPEVLDPWRTPPPAPSTSEVVDPWTESATRLSPPR